VVSRRGASRSSSLAYNVPHIRVITSCEMSERIPESKETGIEWLAGDNMTASEKRG
jgi:hypothetical protein